MAARGRGGQRAAERAQLPEPLERPSRHSVLANTHGNNNTYKSETKQNEVVKWKRGPCGGHRKSLLAVC